MTRFARRGGVAEKRDNKKKKEEATEWEEMFANNESNASNTRANGANGTNRKGEWQQERKERIQKHKKDYESRINMENNGYARQKQFSRPFKSKHDYVMDKYSGSIDKEVLEYLLEMKKKRKLSEEEFLNKVMREARSNQRRLDRQDERENKRVCFKCRQPGHAVYECPQMKNDSEQGTGICYKCGSTEHAVQQCKVKLESGKYPYAKCFICNETGHLSKQCPDNPRGLYPNGNVIN
jgi:hypothetical protein